MKFRIFTY